MSDSPSTSKALPNLLEIKTLVQSSHLWFAIWSFIITTSILFLWLGYSWAERVGLFLGLLVSIFLNLLVFVFGHSSLLTFFKAKAVRGQDPWGLQKTTQELAKTLHMKLPTLYVFESPAANAFTVGIPWQESAIGISSGLLQKLTEAEIEAALTLLLVQIKQSETFSHGIATVLANTIAGTAQQIDKFWPINFFFDKKQKPFLWILSPLGWLLLKLVRTAKSYSRIDILACEILGQRQTLAETLWKLQGLAETCPLEVPPCSSHHFIVNPESATHKIFFRKTHPSMKYRIEKLIGYYPI